MDFENRLKSIDWADFSGPKLYDATELVDAIISLHGLSRPDNTSDQMLRRVLCAIGNDSQGTYYPAIFKALGFIQEISMEASNKHASHLASCILWVVGSRVPHAELGSYSKHTAEEIEVFVSKQNDMTGVEDPWRPSKKPRWKFWL